MNKIFLLALCFLLVGSAFGQDRVAAIERTTLTAAVSAGNTCPTMPEDLFDDCVLWLPFGRNTGMDYLDCSRSANNGTATNTGAQPTWTNAHGGALVFDGVNDQVYGPVLPNTNTVTVAAMLWPTAGTNATRFAVARMQFYIGNHRMWLLDILAGVGWRWWTDSDGVDGGSIASFGTSAVTSGWTFVCGTIDGTNQRIYINGVLEDTDAATTIFPSGTAKLTISGSDNTMNPGATTLMWHGTNAATWIWTRALSSNEVWQMYGTAKQEVGL